MRAFLEKQGFSFKTPADQQKIKSYLLANLARMRDEIRRYIGQVQKGERSQLFQDRGISLDTNLWPDFLIDQHLESMAQKGLLRPELRASRGHRGARTRFRQQANGDTIFTRGRPFSRSPCWIR